MSRTKTRSRGATLAGALAIGCLINQGIALASPDPAASPTVQPESAVTPAATRASVPINGLSTLTVLHVPELSATVTPGGYAGQDLLIDVSADLVDRDETFTIQRQSGDAWEDAASGTTSGPQDTGSVLAIPAGTYRVVVPAQHGMNEFVGEPFQHAPRQLTASIARTGDDLSLTVSPNAEFTWQRSSGGDWQSLDSRGTVLSDPRPGTYRVFVPHQSDALGTVSNSVTVAAAPVLAPVSTYSSGASAPAASAPIADAPGSGGSSGVVATGMAQVGDAYRSGGTGPNAFDCSGLTSYAYRLNGVSIPRTAAAQYAASAKVSNPRPGDLVFFLNGAEHVGIYLGNGRMVHAANSRTGVVVSNINSGWYSQHLTGFGRY